jgi:cation-transporting ATPase F
LGSDGAAGLSQDEATRRLTRYGPNTLAAVRVRGPLVRLLLQFHSPLIYVLLSAALITAVLGERVDAAVIAGVVVVNALVGFVQEAHAENALAAPKNANTPHRRSSDDVAAEPDTTI